jgi:hypothetical protein
MTAFPSYSTGTVSIAASATSVVGVGSNWTGQNAMPGDTLVVGGHQVVVQDVTDSLHLAIDAWPFSAVSAVAYVLYKNSPLRFVGGQAMASVSKLVDELNTDGFYVFVGPTLTVPDPSYGNENQFAFQASTGKLWLKTGGAWVFQGVFKGFNITGAYNPATAYNINDVLSSAGSSYVVIAPTTGNAPPNATYYALQASIGQTGNTGATGPGYQATSATSFLIGTGSKAFTTQAGLAYTVGARVRASSNANGANYMEGLATAYSGTTLTVNVSKVAGSGTFADWNINVAGDPGSGDLLSTNNLSDISNKKTALDNLSLHGADIAAAATLNLETAAGNFVHVTGNTGITAITLSDGHRRTVMFTGTPLLTNGASLLLPGAANIQIAANDIAVFVGDASGVVRCTDYLPSGGLAKSPGTRTRTVLASGSGTYTTPAGCKALEIRMVGGGGAGGGGGTGSGVGNGGGSTTFGTSFLTCIGGSGGGGNGSGSSAGGTASGGDINIAGGMGGESFGAGGASSVTQAPSGGNSAFGGAGAGGWSGQNGSAAATNSGAGGGAGGAGTSTTGAAGAAGGYVEKLITSPLASYAYAVGAGGTGGSAGTSGQTGGAGGSGVIIIDEWY